MSVHQDPTQISIKDAVAPVVRVLKQLGGKFVFVDESGEEFIIARARDLQEKPVREAQLSLPSADVVASAIRKNVDTSVEDEVIDRINRDIAMASSEQKEEQGDVREDEYAGHGDDLRIDPGVYPSPPPVRVKFESIKGDLPPELQE